MKEGVLNAAVIQLNAGPDIADNIAQAERLIRAAAKDGARLIATPENTCRMRASVEGKWAESFEEGDHPALKDYRALAAELNIMLVIGSISSIRVGDHRFANRSYVIAPDGEIVATYDKIHMFDADLSNGDHYRESETNVPGERLVLAKMDGAQIGLSICYDLRFPDLYRRLAQAGAEILMIPAAFTVPTGKAHWEILLRARAIENRAFVMAAAQGGPHDGGRATWGHSMIISPDGEILAEIQGDSPGYKIAALDLAHVQKARAAIPSLNHDQPMTGPV